MNINVINYNANGKIIDPKKITIKVPLIYELIDKYYKKQISKEE